MISCTELNHMGMILEHMQVFYERLHSSIYHCIPTSPTFGKISCLFSYSMRGNKSFTTLLHDHVLLCKVGKNTHLEWHWYQTKKPNKSMTSAIISEIGLIFLFQVKPSRAIILSLIGPQPLRKSQPLFCDLHGKLSKCLGHDWRKKMKIFIFCALPHLV